MTGYIAITDYDWYADLLGRPTLDEVNFWTPSPRNLPRLQLGGVLFFKLRAKYGSPIVGFGLFEWSSTLPAWLVWDTFREANGAADRATMLERIGRLRRETHPDPAGRYEVGCLMLRQPVFFEQENWVRGPADWPRHTERWKRYSLVEGEGRRIFEECISQGGPSEARVIGEPAPASEHDAGLVAEGPRHGRPIVVQPRLGQRAFRVAVIDAYGRACAVTGEKSLPALEAAHIRPFEQHGPHALSNGLLLRADLHRLFDAGFVTVTQEHRFKVSGRLRDEFRNGLIYYDLQQRIERAGRIRLPANPAHWPDPDFLAWHGRERFIA